MLGGHSEVAKTTVEVHPGASSRQNAFASLFAWRTEFGFGWLESLALILFTLIAGYTLHYHEPWDDEAQSWLIARDNNIWQILVHRLHYEGAPPLWHLVLHFFQAVGGTYAGVGWLSVVFSVIGIYVFLRFAPFPLFIRITLPFTFFLLYQHTVIARGYVLMPLLLFCLCVLYWRRSGAVPFAIAAGLLANISVQGFVLAFSLGGLYLLDRRRPAPTVLESEEKRGRPQSRPNHLTAATIIFACMSCIAIYCAIPAPDLNFAIGDQVSTGTVHKILLVLVGETPRNAPRPQPAPPMAAPPWPPQPEPNWHAAPRVWLAWQINHRDVSSLGRHPALTEAVLRIIDILSQATWPIANSNLLACLFLGVTALWLRKRGALRMLLPWVSLICLGVLLWTAEHHAGILLLALISGIWIAAESPNIKRPAPELDLAFVLVFAIVMSLQIGWSVYCVRADVYGSYDPGKETAMWMQAHPKARVAAFHFQTVSIQPWFSHSPFLNVPTSWWQWSSNVEIDSIHQTILDSHPDRVVFGMESPGYGQIRDQWLPLNIILPDEERTLAHDAIVKDLHDHGYLETHRFCGTRFARFSSAYRNCNIIFEPTY